MLSFPRETLFLKIGDLLFPKFPVIRNNFIIPLFKIAPFSFPPNADTKVSLLTLRSNTTSEIRPFSRECFLCHYGEQLKTAVEQEAGEKTDSKR